MLKQLTDCRLRTTRPIVRLHTPEPLPSSAGQNTHLQQADAAY